MKKIKSHSGYWREFWMSPVIIFSFLILGYAVLVIGHYLFGSQKASAAGESDAIAIRVVSNPKQYTIDEWYADQGFNGSPQKMTIDGYDAVRDDRTVYVAGTNIVGGDNPTLKSCAHDPTKTCSTSQDCPPVCTISPGFPPLYILHSTCFNDNCVAPQLYFNIYIITYNQGAASETSDVFGKILSNWKFNNNLTGNGTCSFPPTVCAADSDCAALGAATCDVSGTKTCVSKTNCLLDADCAIGNYCTSPKAELLRDTRRLFALNDLQAHLKTYYDTHGRYPTLNAGTYLPQVAISTWPSWQTVFGAAIGLSGDTDPVNKLGLCTANYLTATSSDPGYDSQTCWNASAAKFYGGKTAANMELPHNSSALVYTTDVNGSNYKVCAGMETGYSFMNIDNQATNLAASNCQFTGGTVSGFSGAINHAPVILSSNLNGISGQPFTGYVKAMDPDGNPLTFSTDISAPITTALNFPQDNNVEKKSWLDKLIPPALAQFISRPGDLIITPIVFNNWFSWDNGQGPSIYKTSDPNQRKLYSPKAGSAGSYSFHLTVTDSLGASTSTVLTINIAPATNPTISAGDFNFNTTQTSNLDVNVYFDAPVFDHVELSDQITVPPTSRALPGKTDNFFSRVSAFLKPLAKLSDFNLINPAEAQVRIRPNLTTYDLFGNPITISGGSGGRIIGGSGGSRIICIVNSDWKFGQTNGVAINNNLRAKLTKDPGSNRYTLNINGNLLPDCSGPDQFATDKDLAYILSVCPGTSSAPADCIQKKFTIHLKANPPQLVASCNKKTTLYEGYDCVFRNLNASNAQTTYSLSGAPSGLMIDPASGHISGAPTQVGDYDLTVTATNEFQTAATFKYTLTVVNSCDGTIQYFGGPWDKTGDFRDGEGYYRKILIGNQCWLRDNLNIVFSSGEPTSGSPIGRCLFGVDTNCDAFGRLYTWAEAMNAPASGNKGLCPTGWHVPSDADWNALVAYLDAHGITPGKEALALKAALPNFDGVDNFGFSGLPTGLIYPNSTCDNIGPVGYYWSSDSSGAYASDWTMDENYPNIFYDYIGVNYALAVRCIKD